MGFLVIHFIVDTIYSVNGPVLLSAYAEHEVLGAFLRPGSIIEIFHLEFLTSSRLSLDVWPVNDIGLALYRFKNNICNITYETNIY